MKKAIEIKLSNKKKLYIFNIICSIFLILSTTTLITSISLKSVLEKNVLSNSLQNIDISKLEVNSIIKNEDLKQPLTLDEFIYEQTYDERITQEGIQKILSDKRINDFLESKVKNYTEFIQGKEIMPRLSYEEIEIFIRNNEDLIKQNTEIELVPEDYEEFKLSASKIVNNYNESIEETLVNSGFSKKIKFFISKYFIYINVILMTLTLSIWMLIYNKYNFNYKLMLQLYGLNIIITLFGLISIYLLVIEKAISKFTIFKELSEILKQTIISNSLVICSFALLPIIFSFFVSKITKEN